MEPQEALHRVLFLKKLPEEVITAIAAAGEKRSLQKGEFLVAETARCIGLIVVLRGAVKIYKLDNRGRELTLDIEREGASVLELPLFDGGNYPASAEAAEENTSVFIVPTARFRHLMAAHPQITEQALWATAIRMRKLVRMVEVQTLHTVRARLASYLLRIAAGRTTFWLEETNETIGSQIGTVRDVVSRTLSNLKEAETIQLQGRRVTIQNLQALYLIAGSGEESIKKETKH